jgi:hypothetical protein
LAGVEGAGTGRLKHYARLSHRRRLGRTGLRH